MEKLVINGIEYERIEHEPKQTRKGSSRMLALASMMALIGGGEGFNMYDGFGNSYSRSLPSNIDIIKEFELIQQKKSNLSKWERDQVIRIFNQNFKPCNNTANT